MRTLVIFFFFRAFFTRKLRHKRARRLHSTEQQSSLQLDPKEDAFLYVEDVENTPITVIREIHVLSELPADQVKNIGKKAENFVVYNPSTVFRSFSKNSVCKKGNCVDEKGNVYTLNLKNQQEEGGSLPKSLGVIINGEKSETILDVKNEQPMKVENDKTKEPKDTGSFLKKLFGSKNTNSQSDSEDADKSSENLKIGKQISKTVNSEKGSENLKSAEVLKNEQSKTKPLDFSKNNSNIILKSEEGSNLTLKNGASSATVVKSSQGEKCETSHTRNE
jgi:hypothetical protein